MNRLKRPLPEHFIVPTDQDYHDLIEGLDRDINEEGSARAFLRLIRSGRHDSHSFTTTLYDLAHWAMATEQLDGRGLIKDRTLRLASTTLSGMIFGHLINESAFPDIPHYAPYERISINRSYMGDAVKDFDENGALEKPEGRLIGHQAMAAFMLNQLSNESVGRVESWSMQVISYPNYRRHFVDGFGLALYAAWDVYTDQMIAEGRPYYIDSTAE